MKILHLSDTHNKHRQLTDLPDADVFVHCGDFTDNGTEEEILDFLNWLIELPYPHKIFITGNHDICLWKATSIEELPDNIHFLQDCYCEINGFKFFGLTYNHPESLIPHNIDILLTHEPPFMILDESNGIHWGNSAIKSAVFKVSPRYHLFGHSHESFGNLELKGINFYNGAILDNNNVINQRPKVITL